MTAYPQLSRSASTLLGGACLLVLSNHACSSENGEMPGAQGGERSVVATSGYGDVDSRGDGDQSGTGPGGQHSALVGELPEVESDRLRLQFIHLPGPSAGSGTDFQFLPGKNKLLVTLRESKIALLELAERATKVIVVWDFKEQMLTGDACGPTNLLLDPNFASNQFIYVSYCKDSRTTQLVRYKFTEETGPISPHVIFETRVAEHELWRRFGSMGFEDSETIWMLVGDHGVPNQAQDRSSPLGALVHISINQAKSDSYGAGDAANWDSWAYGFRAPWRGTRDAAGRYWIGDVGEQDFEEVNLVTTRGQNFGWDLYTGPCNAGCSGSMSPLVHYDRSSDHSFIVQEPKARLEEGRAVWVGQIYQNAAVDRYAGLMNDVVAFGDLFTGAIRGLRADPKGKITFHEPIGFLQYITQWRVGPDGYIYVLDLGGNLHVAVLARD